MQQNYDYIWKISDFFGIYFLFILFGTLSFKMRFNFFNTKMEHWNIGDSTVFSAVHDQLASLDKDAQLTRCFSAVAELVI